MNLNRHENPTCYIWTLFNIYVIDAFDLPGIAHRDTKAFKGLAGAYCFASDCTRSTSPALDGARHNAARENHSKFNQGKS